MIHLFKSTEVLRSSSWQLAELLCYAEAGEGRVMQWQGTAGVLAAFPDLLNWASCIRERERKKAWTVMHTALGWSSCWTEAEVTWTKSWGLWFIWTHRANPVFNRIWIQEDPCCRTSLGIQSIAEICLGFFHVLSVTWMLIKLLSACLIFGVSCSSLPRWLDSASLALRWRYWCRNPIKTRENLFAQFLWGGGCVQRVTLQLVFLM